MSKEESGALTTPVAQAQVQCMLIDAYLCLTCYGSQDPIALLVSSSAGCWR